MTRINIDDTIREQDPLKQGLKLDFKSREANIQIIREQDPLKQGLKLKITFYNADNDANSRARSTKTRIETT